MPARIAVGSVGQASMATTGRVTSAKAPNIP
jgi:hypothetical protein